MYSVHGIFCWMWKERFILAMLQQTCVVLYVCHVGNTVVVYVICCCVCGLLVLSFLSLSVVKLVSLRCVVCEAKNKRLKGWIMEANTASPILCSHKCNHKIGLLQVATIDYGCFLYYTVFIHM